MSMILAGKPAFPVPAGKVAHADQLVLNLITTNSIMFCWACRNPCTVRNVSSDEVNELMDAAQQSILGNMSVVKEIEDVNEDDLRFFFNSVQLFEYYYNHFTLFEGMSSFDGSRIYLNRTTLARKKEVSLWDRQELEHQYMNCLSCWGKFDPWLVSSWSNPNLRSLQRPDSTMGAGHFYEEHVYQKRISPPSPFQLNGPYQIFRG